MSFFQAVRIWTSLWYSAALPSSFFAGLRAKAFCSLSSFVSCRTSSMSAAYCSSRRVFHFDCLTNF
jgi:hypothetical protein